MSNVIGKFVPSESNQAGGKYPFSSTFEVVTKLDDDGKWWNSEGAPGFKGVMSNGEEYHVFSDKWEFIPL